MAKYRHLIVALIFFCLSSAEALARTVGYCSGPPLSIEEFPKLRAALDELLPESKHLGINAVATCPPNDGEAVMVEWEPHIVSGDYRSWNLASCERAKQGTWSCSRVFSNEVLINGERSIELSGVGEEDAIALREMIEAISLKQINDALGWELAAKASELDSYRQIHFINRGRDGFSVQVQGGLHGNLFQLKRVECGLEKCGFEIVGIGQVIYCE